MKSGIDCLVETILSVEKARKKKSQNKKIFQTHLRSWILSDEFNTAVKDGGQRIMNVGYFSTDL